MKKNICPSCGGRLKIARGNAGEKAGRVCRECGMEYDVTIRRIK